ncbi:TIGR03564 family F420-dependent LLM class oxidoreductase [Amycolatopsis granulosa]|uniref:TIGR03564 family F420-dependent LLM class oxidoreductase n=1 Tax=Amycolatopsis granulosa TaxID=185684 RepID=UPI001421DC96|nr:TIGR03564 family F420-dependent LLM class oxidoreductase [Amycolatopsis granulosa]NIH86848.1 F420-dependent oxidoreductase-like protein [Amycolatopsis granulosa]
MRIGLMVDDSGKTIDDIVAAARSGLPALWLGQRFGWDPLTALAVAGQEVPGVELGTAIVPTWPQHPIKLAVQALSTQAVTGNRLSLGVGLSHPAMIEDGYGLSYDRPARHLREYLSALGPLLRGESIAYRGETLAAQGRVDVAGAKPPALLVSALGDLTLRVAGELADGTITTWAGPRALGEHIVPKITKAAAGRAEPRVIAGVIVAVTDDPGSIRAWVAREYGIAASLPAYRAILDREGVREVADTVVTGDEATVERELRRHLDAGATEFAAALVGSPAEQARTLELLRSLNS